MTVFYLLAVDLPSWVLGIDDRSLSCCVQLFRINLFSFPVQFARRPEPVVQHGIEKRPKKACSRDACTPLLKWTSATDSDSSPDEEIFFEQTWLLATQLTAKETG